MLPHSLRAALLDLLLTVSAHGFVPTKAAEAAFETQSIGFNENYVHMPVSYIPQLHIHSLDNMNLTSVSVWSPHSSIERRNQANEFNCDKTVGKLQWSNGISCTAALIGPRHIFTARHCSAAEKGIGLTFEAGLEGDSAYGTASVEHTYMIDLNEGVCRTKNDFAVMVLGERLGDELGWFEVTLPDSSGFNEAIFSTRGYPGNRDDAKVGYDQRNITLPNPLPRRDESQFSCDATGPIYSSEASWYGQSGSGLWDEKGNIWGVMSSGYANVPYSTGWASGDAMLSTIRH